MSSASAPERLYLLDAYALIFQVFHALPEMSTPTGLPSNALFGFTKDVLYLRLEKKPEYLVCAFDEPGLTFRDELYKEYKAHRAPIPDDLLTQVPMIRQMLDAMRVPVLGVPGYEADDIIATVAKAAAARGLDVVLCTSDKDCRQLLTDRIQIYNLRKRQEFNRDALMDDWGVKPEQVIDLQALVGDSVDNVPGVPGIGYKTAAKLLQENLRAATATLPLARQLVRLADDVPLALDWDGWRLQDWDAPRLLALFKEWGFRTFADQVRANSSVLDTQYSILRAQHSQAAGNNETDGSAQGELFPFGIGFGFVDGDVSLG